MQARLATLRKTLEARRKEVAKTVRKAKVGRTTPHTRLTRNVAPPPRRSPHAGGGQKNFSQPYDAAGGAGPMRARVYRAAATVVAYVVWVWVQVLEQEEVVRFAFAGLKVIRRTPIHRADARIHGCARATKSCTYACMQTCVWV